MNTPTATPEWKQILRPFAILSAMGAASFVLQSELRGSFLLSFAAPPHPNSYLDWLAALPGFLLLILLLQEVFRRIWPNRIQEITTILYGSVFLFCSPRPFVSSVLIIGATAFFYLELFTRKFRKTLASRALYLALAVLILYVPVAIYQCRLELDTSQFFFLLIFKTCFMMRLVSWIVDRRLYEREDHGSLTDFLEFLLCPIFLVIPGQIQYFTYQYFHRSKAPVESDRDYWIAAGIGAWGIFLIGLYNIADIYFAQHFVPWLDHKDIWTRAFIYLGAGFYWLLTVYFLQAGGMSFQVCMARCLGYQIKYDMHRPLAARSPLDYLRRHSSYVRDYIVEVGVRPIGLGLLRYGIKPEIVAPVAAILSYAVLILPQTGYRADYSRPFASSFVLVGFLILFILISRLPFFSKNRSSIESPIDEKAFRDWTTRDFALWAGTLLILAVSKALFIFCRTL